jgi:serine/threonine-protein kinase
MENISIENELLINRIAMDFEAAWNRPGPRPQIEKWLVDNYNADRERLLHELLLVEIDLRQNLRESFTTKDYHERFPKDQTTVQKALDEWAAGRSVELEHVAEQDETVAGHDALTHPDEAQDFELPSHRLKGRVFGDYRIQSELGSGAMGDVFLAKQISLNRDVALKLISVQWSGSKKAIQRFETEARAAASLEHPNVVKIYDFGQADGVWYLAMPVVGSHTLQDVIARAKTDQRSLLDIIAKTADGVDCAHQCKVIHRDIKPSNILIDRNGNPVVADFGMAKQLDEVSKTQTADLLGTPSYMSPEQASGSRDIRSATDIFSLGVILYQVVTKSMPFVSETAWQTMRQIIEKTPQSPRKINPGISRDLETIIMKCLEKSPAARYKTAGELAADLRAYLRGAPIVARPCSLPFRMYRWTRREPAYASVIGSLFLLSIVGGIATLNYRKSAAMESDLKQVAVQQRNDAVAAQKREQELRAAAEAATRKAEEATRFANTQRMRADIQASSMALEAGNLDKAARLEERFADNAEMISYDTRWFIESAKFHVPLKSWFTTSDWGLYDSMISPDGKRIATVDRAGRADIWDIASGKQTHSIAKGAWQEETKMWVPRLAVLAKQKDPQKFPSFYSSIDWQDDDTVLLTTIKGALIRHDLKEVKSSEVLQHAEQLHFVRHFADQANTLLADGAGSLKLIGDDGNEIKSFDTGSTIVMLRDSMQLNGWLVGNQDGTLRWIDRDLNEIASLNFEGRIHDARTYRFKSETRLLVSAGELPIQNFSVALDRAKPSERIQLQAEFDIPQREAGNELRRVQFDLASNRMVAIDDRNRLHLWNITSGDYVTAFGIGSPKEYRQASPEQALRLDAIESRNLVGLEWFDGNILSVDFEGTVKVHELGQLVRTVAWQDLTIKLGPHPQLAADRKVPGRSWALDRNGALSLISLTEDRVLAQVPDAHAGGREELVQLKNGDVATVGNDRFIRFWRWVDQKIVELRRIESKEPLVSVAIHEKTNRVAAVDAKGVLQIWSLDDGRHVGAKAYAEATDELIEKHANGDVAASILTGKVAFSRDGTYIGAYGPLQCFEVFETETLKQCSLVDRLVAGAGGTAITFSPIVDRMLMTSATNGMGANAVRFENGENDSQKRLHRNNAVTIDFGVTWDRRRLLGLTSKGTINFFAAEHLVPISSLTTPWRNCVSIAMCAGDRAVVVGRTDGSIGWSPLGDWANAGEPSIRIQGLVHSLLKPSDAQPLVRGTLLTQYQIRDRDGHLQKSFVVGGVSEISVDRKFHVLRKRDAIWRLDAVPFEGIELGPCLHSQLFTSPKGRTVAVIRQGLTGTEGYNGRVILAYETEEGPWAVETVLDGGNAGFSPHVVFDNADRPVRVLMCDQEWMRFIDCKRPEIPKEWPGIAIRTNAGLKTSGVVDRQGNHHLLTRRKRGWSTLAPPLLFTLKKDREFVADKSIDAKGHVLMITSDDRLVSWNQCTGELFELQADKVWKSIAKLNSFGDPMQISPWMDDQDRIWFCECQRNEIVFQCFKDGDWMSGVMELDLPFSADGLYCHGNINDQGRLEVLVCQYGQAGLMAVVESVLPLGLEQ